MTLNLGTCHGVFRIAGITTVDPAGRWGTYDLRPITLGRNTRGDDVEIPGIDGVIENERRFASTPLNLPFAIDGHIDDGGYEVGRDGAEERILTYYAEAVDLYVASSVTFVLTTPSGQIWSSRGHVEDLEQRSDEEGIWDGLLALVRTQPWTIT